MSGYERKIILLKNTGSEIFDEAYFILKEKQGGEPSLSESEMIREANRIVSENLISGYFRHGGQKGGDRGERIRVFLLGFVLGLLAAGVAAAFLH